MCIRDRRNSSPNRTRTIYIPEYMQTFETDPAKGVEGSYVLRADISGSGRFEEMCIRDRNKTLSRKVWINDVLVLDNSTNVGDVWQEGCTQAGFNYLFGIESGTGTMTIESFEYKPLL